LHLPESSWCQESVGCICFTNKWRAAFLRPLTFSNHCSNVLFSNASPGLTACFFGGEHRVFLKDGVKTYRMAPMSPFNSAIFFCLHIYSLWVSILSSDKNCITGLDASTIPWCLARCRAVLVICIDCRYVQIEKMMAS
jgi:hypothetical protein